MNVNIARRAAKKFLKKAIIFVKYLLKTMKSGFLNSGEYIKGD